MSCPRLFVSSTFYDLKHVREIIRKYILDLGYEPVLSEFSDIFYKPNDTIQNSCLLEISNCDMFILIVGKRYGSNFPEETLSVTHKEYIEAQNTLIPIYAFIDIDVLHDYEFYLKNNRDTNCHFRCVTDTKVFELIDEIRNAAKDNSLISYSSIDEILQHLKKQWASLFKSFLQNQRQSVPKDTELVKLNLEKLNQKINTVGIENIEDKEVLESASITEVITKRGGTCTDNGTDYGIEIKGKHMNIGKDVMKILDEEFKRAKKS